MANGGLQQQSGDWLEYEVNTLNGSSGSPVFNNKWDLVALHSRAGTDQVNKGVAISSIIASLGQRVRQEIDPLAT
jgi:endonuclease G